MTTQSIGANTGDTFPGIVDAYLDSVASAVNYGSSSDLYIHENTTVIRHSVMKFTGLSNIVGPVSVSSAVLSIKNRDAVAGTTPVSAFKLLVPFVVGQVTWNKRDSTNNWTSTGGRNATDADTSAALATGTIPSTSETFFTMTGAGFNAYIEGVINGSITDHGILLVPTQAGQVGSNAVKRLGSNEAVTNGNRVYLTVTYTTLTPPNITVDDITVNNLSGTATFTISLSTSFASPVTVYRKTTDDTATSPDDFTALPLELVTFAPGETTKTVEVTLVP